jgi:hypothetical protein
MFCPIVYVDELVLGGLCPDYSWDRTSLRKPIHSVCYRESGVYVLLGFLEAMKEAGPK